MTKIGADIDKKPDPASVETGVPASAAVIIQPHSVKVSTYIVKFKIAIILKFNPS